MKYAHIMYVNVHIWEKSMKNTVRKDEILEILHRYNYVTVEYLAETLFISPSSIRRDLALLESQGLVKRSHGGVHSVENSNVLTPYSMRMQENSIAKRKICEKAASLVNDGDFIFIDGSTTCLYLPELLESKKNITILTNNLKLAAMFKDTNGISVYCTGGKLRPNEYVGYGPMAESACEFLHTNIMFFSARAIDENGTIQDINEPETVVRHKAMQNTDKAVFLCDSTKFNKTSAFRVCEAKDVHIVTDNLPDDDTIMRWQAKEIL